MTTHFAYIELVKVDTRTGLVIDKNNSTLAGNLHFDTQHRMVPDPTIPNTAGAPTIQAYLNLEAAANFIPVQVGQSFVLTYHT